jgi:hypothetical protein
MSRWWRVVSESRPRIAQGSGVAQATIGNVNGGISLTRFNAGTVAFGGLNWTLAPAHPGDTVVLWGTGGGADPANDTGGTSGDQTAAGNFVVNVDGRAITPPYAGASSGFPGLWQVNFTLPPDITLDCFASVQVSAGGELSNSVIIPIAGAGQASCVDPNTPATILTKLDTGGNIVIGGFALAKIAASTTAVAAESASGSILSFSAAEWLALNSGPLFGACRVYDRTYPAGGLDPATPDAYLDAGSTLSLAGPNLAAGTVLTTVATPRGHAYGNAPAAGTLTGGTYTLTAQGGTQVGPFTVPTSFPASFTVTNFDTTTIVDRSKPLTFNWTGSAFDQVAIVVSTAVATSTTRHLTTINCTVPGAPGTYSIPAAALAYLSPAAATGAAFGTIAVEGLGKPGSFTANLVAGGQIDWGTFSSNYGLAKSVAVQ